MKKLLIIPLFLILCSMTITGCSSSEKASKDHELVINLSAFERVSVLTTEFLNAYEKKDVDKLAELINDNRYSNKAEQKRDYEKNINELTSMEIYGLIQKSEDEFEMIIRDAEGHENTFPIKLVNEEWIIIQAKDIQVN